VEAKAKELWDESAPIREIYDLYSKLADFADDAFMGTIGLVPDLFKYGSQQKDWGAKCGSCNPIPTLPLQTQPPPTPTPAQ
jgi:hypothetical protein